MKHLPPALLLALALPLAAHADTASAPVATAPVEVSAASFKCIRNMTAVRGFFVDNIAGNLEGTLAVARSPDGGVYPPGSVVQLFPNEAMVKREAGFNQVTHDWEFFELDVDKQGTTIRKRGFQDVMNRFGGNCFGCHVQAKPAWDLICEQDHGCARLSVSRYAIKSLQNADARCDNRETPWTQKFTNWMIRALTPL